MLIHAFQNRNAVLTRWIGLLLAVYILYGTNVEAAHRHGRVLPSSETTSQVHSEQTRSPVNSKTGCSHCLICQLHQHFSTTLLAFRIVDPPKPVRIKVLPAIPPDVVSLLAGPTAGRAPPSIS